MSRPNILLIITDSQGRNLLGESGDGHIATANLDRLAGRGISFTRAYNTCPLCTPARAGLFTGLHPHNAGAWSNDLPLGGNVRTMGEYLQEAGYDTAYVGKWHLDGTDYFGTGICPPGWNAQYWYDGRNYLQDLSVEERKLWRSGLRSSEAIRNHGVSREWTWAGRVTDRATNFLRNHRIDAPDKPWLLVASYDEPHGPSVCPPPFCDMYKDYAYPLPENAGDDLRGKPAHHREWAQTFSINKDGLRQPLYFGASSFVDDEIGRLLWECENYEDTIVIFTTDHGHYLGAHGLDGKGPALYEEVIRVPLIIAGAGIPAGVKCDSLISHVDILPTLLQLAGERIPPLLEGTGALALLRDPTQSIQDHVQCEFHRFSVTHDSWFGFIPIRTLISREHKLTVNLHQSDELYDLSKDPLEMENLIVQSGAPSVAGDLHRALLQAMDGSRDPFRGPGWADRPWSPVQKPTGIGGYRRPRPEDGESPPTYNYETGLPADYPRREKT